ncbi:hypothetical protein BT93_L4637 [Corymbia citriodora subsp. variegata]|uniref:Enhancer of polycomb-like protein n=1 Tax=Corymbia citriodora subsp. variegata TaxID=360336 RepID=A0A8T0CJN7_CORYI|nr:hypothetical protein BT93_L4637 [Corymbia citriodora subsp. variegata]
MSRVTGRHTRPKKLTPKQNVYIFREEQVDSLNDVDATRGPVETGVDKSEESEYHLQQAIKASQKANEKVKDAYIPTPPTLSSDIQYDVLYPFGWQQPATYIRSSATVEDSAGVPYCMDEEDEVGLLLINKSLPSDLEQLDEDRFEAVMNHFEETAQAKQPFAAVDNPPVLPLDELEQNYDDTIPEFVRIYAGFVYDHWCRRRTEKINHAIGPNLKFETGSENDDADPYVCFRRREVRQIRRTRNRDNASQEKLKKLRQELEQARNLLIMVKQREQMRRDSLVVDKEMFEQRHHFREIKRKLNIAGDDELLINQKKQKLPPVVTAEAVTPMMVARPGPELKTIDDIRAEKQRAIDMEIETNVDKHIRWNEGYIDKTTFPITPEEPVPVQKPFLAAYPATEYLPTPPASASGDEASKEDVPVLDISRSSTPFRYASPMDDDSGRMPSFRCRIGRGGRILLDRRLPRKSSAEKDERFRFDVSSDEETEELDQSFADCMNRRTAERASLLNSNSRNADQSQQSRRVPIEQASAAAQSG